MLEYSNQEQSMGEVNALILGSVRQYEDILALFAAINSDSGDNNPATLESRGTEIMQMQEQAALTDQALVATMHGMDPARTAQFSAHSLLEKRQDLMRRILIHNRSLLSTINNIKSLLAHEIKEMQDGRVALNGYSQVPSQNGGILNDAH